MRSVQTNEQHLPVEWGRMEADVGDADVWDADVGDVLHCWDSDEGERTMPRYIDLDKQLVRLYLLNLTCEDVIKAFLSSADVVPLVQCRECKHKAEGQGYCYKHGIWLHRMTFCSEGERRDDDDRNG